MLAILFEGALFVGLVGVVVTLLVFLLATYTPLGIWLRQVRNRRQIDRAASLVCPIHGSRAITDLVRLPSGDVVCPDCYKESTHA